MIGLDPGAAGARYAVLRALIGAYVAVWTTVRAPALLDPLDFSARRFDPVGPLWFLEGPLPAAVIVVALVVTPPAAVAVALGRAERSAGAVAALGFLFLTTYRNSWGQLFHTENLVALHLCVLAVAPWAVRSGSGSVDGRTGDRTWAVDAMAIMTVGTYLVAGIAKLRISGWAWVDGDVLRHQIAFDNARKELLGDTVSPVAGWLLRRDWLLAPAAVASMVVELGAPLALLHRRLAGWWCALAWTFHVAIVVFMVILFPYHLTAIALAPLLPVERLGATVAGWTGRFRAASPTSIPTG